MNGEPTHFGTDDDELPNQWQVGGYIRRIIHENGGVITWRGDTKLVAFPAKERYDVLDRGWDNRIRMPDYFVEPWG